MRTLSLLLALALAGAARPAGQADPKNDAAAVLALAREDAPVAGSRVDSTGLAKRFLALMDRLGRAAIPAADDPSAEAEVIRVARDRAAHPELAAELEETYANHADLRNQAQDAPALRLAHYKVARYRYAWEYLLMRHFFIQGTTSYGRRAFDGLMLLHDDASLPLLDGLCKGYAAEYAWNPIHAQQAQGEYLDALAQFVSDRGLTALIDCATAAEEAQRSVGLVPNVDLDVAKLLRDTLTPKRPTPRSQAWAPIITRLQNDPANAFRARTLDRMLGSTARQP